MCCILPLHDCTVANMWLGATRRGIVGIRSSPDEIPSDQLCDRNKNNPPDRIAEGCMPESTWAAAPTTSAIGQ